MVVQIMEIYKITIRQISAVIKTNPMMEMKKTAYSSIYLSYRSLRPSEYFFWQIIPR